MAKKTSKQTQSEVPEPQNGENIPATIVESSDREVFAAPQEIKPTVKPVKASKRPYISLAGC
jgi:hypothetical protein